MKEEKEQTEPTKIKKRKETEEKEQTEPAKKNLRGFIDTIVTFLVLACIVLSGLWLFSAFMQFTHFYLILAVVLFFAANCINSIQIVPQTEIWIIELLGRYNRKLKPGINWTIPWVETIREKVPRYELYLELFDSQKQIIFRDGPAQLKNPRLYLQIDEEHAEDAVYKVDDWRKWANKVLGPIVRGYLNTLSITEALDEGGARGDILEKMRTRTDITQKQIQEIQEAIEKISRAIKGLSQKNKDTGLLDFTKKQLEDKKRDKETCLANQEKIKKELEEFITQAKQRGFKEIYRVGVGEFDISDELEKAREQVQIAQKEQQAAVSKAITEAMMRAEPIVRTKERFRDIGFSEKEAREKAYMIEILETLAKEKSLFLTSAGQGDLNTLAAQIAAIFSEVSQRKKEPGKETKN
jgi:regulator of protease activity HflC (stomatin/prohibitin superfamily)